MDPRAAKSPREFVHRFNRREAIWSSLVDVQSKSDPGVLPYFIDNFESGSRTGIRVPAQSLDELIQAWVRGIHLAEVGQLIPRGYEILVIHVGEERRAQALSGFIEHAKIIQKGPGVEVKILHAEEPEQFGTLYAFDIWNALKCTASVLPVAPASPAPATQP
jgi:hypothetical protein